MKCTTLAHGTRFVTLWSYYEFQSSTKKCRYLFKKIGSDLYKNVARPTSEVLLIMVLKVISNNMELIVCVQTCPVPQFFKPNLGESSQQRTSRRFKQFFKGFFLMDLFQLIFSKLEMQKSHSKKWWHFTYRTPESNYIVEQNPPPSVLGCSTGRFVCGE